jgi:hypothetical protein
MMAPMTETHPTPARDSIGAALQFVRADWRKVLTIALIGAVAATVVSLGAVLVGETQAPLGLVLSLAATFVSAAVYAAYIDGVLYPTTRPQERLANDVVRLWCAMAVVGFFLTIVMFALLLPAGMVLEPFVGPYVSQVQAAGDNEGALMAIGQHFALQNPAVVIFLCALFAIVMLFLSSRLYLAGPASIDMGRIQTFETWSMTKNNVVRIIISRIVLLGPAFVLSQALTQLGARALGFDALQGGDTRTFALSHPLQFGGYVLVGEFVIMLIYNSLEAGLSASFYRILKPKASAQASVF